MAGTKMTYLMCYDEHRSFTDDIRKRFSDDNRYTVKAAHAVEEFKSICARDIEPSSCKVAIIGVPDNKDQFEMIGALTAEVKKSDPKAGIILLVPPDKMEDIKTIVRFNIDAYVPRNVNSVVRIHNTVKKLISEHSITLFRKRRNLALYTLLAFLIFVVLIALIAKLRLPGYF
jgi:DNA-binding NarL/FixJ family response regulator